MLSMASNNKKFYTICWLGTQRLHIEQEKKLNEGDTIKDTIYFDDDDIDNCFKVLQLVWNEHILFVVTEIARSTIVLSEIHNLHQIKVIYVISTNGNGYESQSLPKV